jgi:beta-alanine degradation protein BauB
MAKHATKAAPGLTKVLYENDSVRIIELNVKKGSKAEMHTHPAYFSYSFAPLVYKATSPEGRTKAHKTKAGHIEWSDGESHAVEFTNTARALVVELKEGVKDS